MERNPLQRRLQPPAEPTVLIGDYRRLNEIGKGSFAMVYRGMHVVSIPLCGLFVSPCLARTIRRNGIRLHGKTR
jgi:hypothetical protein